jgi:hypothetical protein
MITHDEASCELLTKAEDYRKLAGTCRDKFSFNALLELAEEYVNLANQTRARKERGPLNDMKV